MAIYAYLFDADGQDRQVKFDRETLQSVGDSQVLWVDIGGDDPDELQRVIELLALSHTLAQALCGEDGRMRQGMRPRLDLYGNCFHLTVDAIQGRDEGADFSSPAKHPPSHTHPVVALRLVTVHFLVFANILVSLHEHHVAFLNSFDSRIKGDTHIGGMDGTAFLGGLLNWHITGYFRALEALESDVDRIDDAALRLRRSGEERDLLSEMVKVRRRLALIRRTLLPHREVYSTLARPGFAPFVTVQATETMQLTAGRVDRAIEATENARELILGSFDIFTTQTALKTNEVVKTLTILSAILLPAGVITNLAPLVLRSPVYDFGRFGFWEIMASMVVIGILFIAVARNRNWI